MSETVRDVGDCQRLSEKRELSLRLFEFLSVNVFLKNKIIPSVLKKCSPKNGSSQNTHNN